MQKVALFYNPHASKSMDDLIKRVTEGLFRSELYTFPLLNPVELKAKCLELIESDVLDFVVIGGDGSVNILIQELAQKNVGLLVIPGGTANDLATELELLGGIEKSLLAFRERRAIEIDLISANGRLFATSGGIGIGAHVTDRINEIRRRVHGTKYLLRFFKHHAYSILLAHELLLPFLPKYQFKIVADNKEYKLLSPLLIVNNQSRIARTIFAGDWIKNGDGLMDLTIFTHNSRTKFIIALLKYVLGKVPVKDPAIIRIQAKEVEIISSKPFKFFGDGEIFSGQKKLSLKVLPKALKVYTTKEV